MLDLNTASILSFFGAVSVIAGAVYRVRAVLKQRVDQKALERALILQEAKEYSNRNKRSLEVRLETLERELENQVKALNKDLEYIKDSYNNELKFLGSKIDELKDEVRVSLSQIVTLVSKLIDKS